MTERQGENQDLDTARALGAYVDARWPHAGPRREALVNAIGAEVVGDQRLRELLTCTICGALGEEGDECGRRPNGHRLTIARLDPSYFGSQGGDR